MPIDRRLFRRSAQVSPGSNIERIQPRFIRWYWEFRNTDGSISAGWTPTRRGALREIHKAKVQDYGVTGPHQSPAVGWPNV